MDAVKVLILTYAFPPVGGAGVQRIAKFCKYLSCHKINLTVLTCKNPSVPVLDFSQLEDIDSNVTIIKASTLEPSYDLKNSLSNIANKGVWLDKITSVIRKILFPDPQILWFPSMLAKLISLLIKNRYNALFISGPPFSQFLAVLFIQPFFKGNIVIDYRDEWETVASKFENGRGDSFFRKYCEKLVLKSATSVTMATPAYKARLLELHPFLSPEKVHVISNGFDPDDYKDIYNSNRHTDNKKRFTITYAGTLFSLTSPAPFVNAVELLFQTCPEIASELQVVFIGRAVGKELDEMHRLKKVVRLEIKDYAPHDTVIKELDSSHLNLIFLSDTEESRRIYPGKVFELMAIGRHVLTITPKGALYDLVVREGLGKVFYPGETEKIADYLIQQYKSWKADPLLFEQQRYKPKVRYSRKELTKQLIQLLYTH